MRKLTNLETGETIDLPGVYSVDEGQQSASHAVTLRDYFAAKALQGYFANSSSEYPSLEYMAEALYRAADAMLKERAK